MAKSKKQKASWGSSSNMWRSPSTVTSSSSKRGICGLIVFGSFGGLAVLATYGASQFFS